MAQIRVYIQPRFPSAANQTAFYDYTNHVEFPTIEWEQNDQGNESTLRLGTYSILPTSQTRWSSYAGATESDKITAALADQFFRVKVYPRTEIQIRDVSTSPHTILWGGIVTRVSEQREGGSITGGIEAVDYTALLSESVALEYTPLAESTIKKAITSQTYTLTATAASRVDGLSEITVSSIAIGTPYNRDLIAGDTLVVSTSDSTYNGTHKVVGVYPSGAAYKVVYQQYTNDVDSASAAVTGSVAVPGFLTSSNAPNIDSRIRVLSANIADLNPDFKWSPKNPSITRTISNVARSASTATVTTSSNHGFSIGRQVTISLASGPSGYAALMGVFTISSTPTNTTFTFVTSSSGTITSGAATGSAVLEGEVTPTPLKGGSLSQNLQSTVDKGTGCFYLNAGTLDGAGALTIDLFVRPKNQIDLVSNGLFESGSSTGWTLGSWLVDSVGNTGPYAVGNTVYYTGSDAQTGEIASGSRIPVVATEKYFISWRQYSDKVSKESPKVKFYDSGGSLIGTAAAISAHTAVYGEWFRDWGIVTVPASSASMSFVLHHEAHASSYTVRLTDIQIIKLTGSFGFSDNPLSDTATYGMTLKDFESPSAPEESGESANRVYVYAPITTEDPLTGAKQLTSYRNVYEFVQGVWEAGGKRIEGSLVASDATDTTLAEETARSYFKERGAALKSFEFEHFSGSLNVGDVIPFIWSELGIAEALVVRKQIGYLIGQDVYYKVQLGGDLAYQRSTMYLVDQRLREIAGEAAYVSPQSNPSAGEPNADGIVTPAAVVGSSGPQRVDLQWEYPESIVRSAGFGGFLVLRSDDAGSTWTKASTGEALADSSNPLSPDTMVPSFTDTFVSVGDNYTYKIAAIDGSGSEPIITGYSIDTDAVSPTEAVSFDSAYSGLGVNVPKIVDSVTYSGNGVAKGVTSVTSGASTTATVTTSSAHTFSTGNIVGITGASGSNASDVNGKFFVITVVDSTSFTVTKVGTNALSLTGGTSTGWVVSGSYVDADANARVLGDAFSLVQFPIGQIAYSEADGKLYRNGKPGTTAFDGYWTRAAVDAIDISADGSVVISADKITTGTLNAANVSVTNLSADNIVSGSLKADRIGSIDATKGLFIHSSGTATALTSASLTVVGASPSSLVDPLSSANSSLAVTYYNAIDSGKVILTIAREPSTYLGKAYHRAEFNPTILGGGYKISQSELFSSYDGTAISRLNVVSRNDGPFYYNYTAITGDANVIGYGLALLVNGFAVALFGHKHVSALRSTATTTSVPANGSLLLGTFNWSTALNVNGNFYATASVEYTTGTKGTSFAVVENVTSTTVDIRLINPTGTADTAERRIHAMGYSDYL